jgi:hypothetical protein
VSSDLVPDRVMHEAWSEYLYPRAPVLELASPSSLSGFSRAMTVIRREVPLIVAAELEHLADEMDATTGPYSITAEDVRARAAQLRGETSGQDQEQG